MDFDPMAQPAPVVVRTARLPPAAGDPAFSMEAVDGIALGESQRLDDALATSPGFSLFRRTSSLGANPTTQGVSLRGVAGSGASRALVTLDGVPQNDPFGGWVIWTGLPPETVSRATLVRGAGAGPYGAGALTGVVALEEPMHIDGGAAADVSGGDRAYGRAAAITEIDKGRARIFVDASNETSGGWIPVNQGRGAVDRPLTLRDWSAAERVELDLGDAALSERLAAFAEDRGAGTIFAASRAQGLQASVGLAAPPQAASPGWRLQAWATASNLANTSASVAAGRNTATLADNQYATPAMGLGVNAAVRVVRSAFSWEAGVDARDVDGESKERLYNQGTPTGQQVSGGGALVAGVYAEGSRTMGGLVFTGGVRLDGWKTYASKLVRSGAAPLDQRPADRAGSVPTGRIGVRRDFRRAPYVRAAAYAGFRPATLNELHRPFRVGNDITEANANLTPERLYGAEAGLGHAGRVRWDGDIFYNRLENAITNVTLGHGPVNDAVAGFVPAGGTLYKRENAGTVNAYGVEGEAQGAFGRAMTVRLAVAWTHARVDGGEQAPQLTGRVPAETAAATLTAGATWRPLARLRLTAEARFESARYDDDLNTRRINAGTGVNLRSDWALSRTLSVFLAADNVLAARIETGRSAANVVTYDAPRLVSVGLTLRR